MKGEEIVQKSVKTNKYGTKTLPKLLIYLGKIKSADKYEAWIKQLRIILLEWFLEVFVIRAFLIFICLSAVTSFYHPLGKIILAEGISLLWFLLIDLKNDLWKR